MPSIPGLGGPNALPFVNSANEIYPPAALINGRRCEVHKSNKTAAGFYKTFWQRLKSFFFFGCRSKMHVAQSSSCAPAPSVSTALPPGAGRCREIFRKWMKAPEEMTDAKAKELWKALDDIYCVEYNSVFTSASENKDGNLLKDAAAKAHASANKKAVGDVVDKFVKAEAKAGRAVKPGADAKLKNDLMLLKDTYRPIFKAPCSLEIGNFDFSSRYSSIY